MKIFNYEEVEEGTSTTTKNTKVKTKPSIPAPPSFKPPLSPEIQAKVDQVIRQRLALHQGESVAYANCVINCGGNNACILRLRIKDGKLASVEPDDTVNKVVGREDSVLSVEDLQKGVLQYRPCQRGYSWVSYINSPDRLLYPMKRIGKGNESKFVRISWKEALDLVADMIKKSKEKYGPYSIGWPYNSMLYAAPSSAYMNYSFTGNVPIGFLAHYGVGTTTWGDPSNDMRLAASTFCVGSYLDAFGAISPPILGDLDPWAGLPHPIADIFEAKFILLWGIDPTSTTQFLGPYYLRLARERGIPVVCIDCKYTKTVEVLSDQWVPIRPGTDIALILAMCYIMFKESSYDKAFVSKWVEPAGFAKWEDYVTGSSDGVPKSPEWAEKITGVPSETIVHLTHKLVSNKPSVVNWFNAPGRIYWGENPCRAQIALQAMLGSIVVSRSLPSVVSITGVNPYGDPASFVPPQLYNEQGLFKAIIKKKDLDDGKITQEQYFRQIGNAEGNPLPNIKMVFQTFGNAVNTSVNTNRSIAAIKLLDYYVVAAFHATPTTRYADVVLPVSNAFEGGFRGIWAPYPPTILLGTKVLDRPGEVMDHEWVYVQLAKRLGVLEKYNPHYTTDEEWEKMWDKLLADAWAATAQANDINIDWNTFKSNYVYRLPSSSPILNPQQHDYAVATRSEKIEIWSRALESGDIKLYPQPFTHIKLHGDDPPYDPPAIPKWIPPPESFWGSKVSKYTLTLITSHSRFRAHSCFDSDPLLNDCYRHAVWLSVADAKKRGIVDGDLVRVYNDLGEMVIPAYVTSKIVPGSVCIYKGANYTPSSMQTALDPEGLDRRGGDNLLTSGLDNPVVVAAVSGQVEVEKF